MNNGLLFFWNSIDKDDRKSFVNSASWTALSIGLLVAVLFPIFDHQYLFHDDWHYFYYKAKNPIYTHTFLVLGRPLGYQIIRFQFLFIHHIGDAWVARLISVVGLGGMLAGLLAFICREGFPLRLAAFLAFAITVLPGGLVFAAWLGAGFVIFGFLASIIAALLCQTAFFRKQRDGAFYLLLLLAVLSEFISPFIYQTAAMTFVVCAGITLARLFSRGDSRQLIRFGAIYGLVAVIANIGYFIWFKSTVGPQLAHDDPARGDLFVDIGGSLLWFFNSLLPRALRLWFVDASGVWIPILIGSAFLISMTVFIVFTIKGSQRNGAQSPKPFSFCCYILYAIFILVLGLGCFLPPLLSQFRLETCRSFLPLSAFILAMTCIHLRLAVANEPWVQILDRSWTIAMVLVGFVAHDVLFRNMVLPPTSEVRYLRNAMNSAKADGYENAPVLVIVPHMRISSRLEKYGGAFASSFNFPSHTDEFGVLSANFAGDVPPMVESIRRDLKLPEVPVTSVSAGDAYDGAGKVVINLAAIANVGVERTLTPDFLPFR